MAAWAKPGVKVVCIAPPRPGVRILQAEDAVVGCVYTIRAVVTGRGVAAGSLGLLLEEIVNPISPIFGCEYGHYLDRFRPLFAPTQEQDVGLFIHHLDGLEVDA